MRAEQKDPLCMSSFNSHHYHKNQISSSTVHRGRDWNTCEVMCLHSDSLSKVGRARPERLVCPTASSVPSLCDASCSLATPALGLSKPPNQSQQNYWKCYMCRAQLPASFKSRTLRGRGWSSLKTEIKVWPQLTLPSPSKVSILVLHYPMFIQL